MSVYPHSFTVKNSNYIEALGYMCTEQMKIPLKDPFAKEHVIVMNTGMKSYLQQFIAQQNGICSNVIFDQLWTFIWNIYKKITPNLGDVHYFDHDYIIWTLYQMLHEEHCADSVDALASVKNYIADDTDGTRTYELCVAIADTFDQYLMYRNDWILMWDAIAQHEGDQNLLIEEWQKAITHPKGSLANQTGRNTLLANVLRDNAWQPVLWIMLFNRLTLNSEKTEPSRYDRAMVIEELCAKLNAMDDESSVSYNLPQRVFLFGVSSLQPQVIRFLRALAKHVDVNVMLLNPCREYWGDIDSQWKTLFHDFKESLNALRGKLKNRDVSRKMSVDEQKRFSQIPGMDADGPDYVYLGKELSTSEDSYDDEGELVEGNALLLSLGKQGKDNLSLMLDSNPGENRLYIKTNELLRNAYEAVPFNQEIKHLYDSVSEPMEPSFDNLFVDPLVAGGESLLHQIQSQMLNLEQPSEHIEIAADDHSFEIHSCFTEQREVEVLRDALLTRFKDSIGDDGQSSLKPRDCLVMMPKIEKYAPYIEAVFGSVDPSDKNYIPYALSDRSSRDSSQIADSVLKLLDIGVKRITLSLIIDLLTVPAISKRYSFSAEDVETINIWCQEANIHWGIDEADAKKDSGVASIPWTFEQGLFRMVKGYLLGDTSEALPIYTEIEGSDAQVLGRFCSFVENLRQLRDELILPEESASSNDGLLEVSKNLKEWSETLETQIFERFFYDGNDPRAHESDTYRECSAIKVLCDSVSEVVERLREDNQSMNPDSSDLKIALPVFRSMLQDKLSKSNEADTFKGSKVIFCSMIPMRAIPFKHIFILGMHDISSPRQDKIPAFNLVGVKGLFRRGDRSRSIDDRYCFMEAILSARESLYISYVGRSPIDNKDRNRSTVLEDLFDYICDVFTVKGVGQKKGSDESEEKIEQERTEALKRRLIRQDTLTSFNPKNYVLQKGDDLTLRHIPSFDKNSFVSEFYTKGETGCERQYLGNRGIDYFKVELEDKISFNASELKKWFSDPAGAFLKQNLEIRLPDVNTVVLSDDEAFSMDGFHKSGLLQELDGIALDKAENYLESQSQSGRLPYGVLSEGLKLKLLEKNSTLSKSLGEVLGQRNISEHQYLRTFEVSLSEFASVLNEPSLKDKKFKVEFSGKISFPNILINYFSDGDYTSNFILNAVLNSFALHYAGLPSEVNTISRSGKIITYNVKLLGENDYIDSLFINLLSIAVLSKLRPLPITQKMLTVVGKKVDRNIFFDYSSECKYLYGNIDNLSSELSAFLDMGRSEDEIATVRGPLALYDIIRGCQVGADDKKADKAPSKKSKKTKEKSEG